MIKKLLSVMAAAIMCLCLIPCITANAANNDYSGWDGKWENSTLIDDEYEGKGLFSDENKKELIEAIQQYSKDLEMNIVVYIGGQRRSDSSTKSFCDDYYDSHYGNDTDGILYYLDLSGKHPAYDYISTAGKCILLYEKNRESIFNYLDNYLPSSDQPIEEYDIYQAVNAYLSELKYYSTQKHSKYEYYHDSNKGTYTYYKNGELQITTKKPPILVIRIWGICALIGFITALITYFVAKSNYKFKSKTNPGIYLSNQNIRFNEKSDLLIRTYTTKHRVQSSSSSGGSHRSGGSHHSGGSHGGGGHHR